MHVAVTGSTGLIGSALVERLRSRGHELTRFVRRTPTADDEAGWDPRTHTIDTDALARCDAVVHLAGEGIGDHRWTAAHKERIRRSRVEGTSLLAHAVAGMDDGPRALVCASGIGYYGDRGDEVLTEDSAPGEDFIAKVCQAWEGAADPARAAGVRVAHLRQGVVQSTRGGALPRQLPLFKLGLGATLGSGRQYLSWITLSDLVGLYEHVLASDGLAGAVNATAPTPVTNAEYTRTLAAVLDRPAFLRAPAFALRLALGEIADGLLLVSQRALPERAQANGYAFAQPELEPALRAVLERPAED